MNYLKLIVAALLLACLMQLPYGFYVLVRFVAMVVFAAMAVRYNEKKETTLAVTFGSLALLFQPFIKLALGRCVWNIVDVVVAILLIVLYIMDRKKA